MKNHTVPTTLTRAALNSKIRVLITLATTLGMIALVFARQIHATAPTFESREQGSQIDDVAGTVQPTSGNPAIDKVVLASSEHYGVDPRLVFAVMKKESRFNPVAHSRKNAMGLMQIVPATAQRFHTSRPFDIDQNVDCGVHYLRWLLERFSGDVRLALAAYNAGENTVIHCGYRVPDIFETRDYVDSIIASYGQTHHPLLNPDEAWQVFSREMNETGQSS